MGKRCPPHVPPQPRILPTSKPSLPPTLVGCCVPQSHCGHLRPRVRPSLYFLMGCIVGPQTSERRAARVHPMHCAIDGPIGGGGAMSWWCCYLIHGARGQSRWRVGQRLLILIVVCCVVCFVVWALLATLQVESRYQPSQNGQLLCTHTTKSAPKHPKY